MIFLTYAITRILAIQQHGPGRHFLIALMHKTRLLCVARLFKLCRHRKIYKKKFPVFPKLFPFFKEMSRLIFPWLKSRLAPSHYNTCSFADGSVRIINSSGDHYFSIWPWIIFLAHFCHNFWLIHLSRWVWRAANKVYLNSCFRLLGSVYYEYYG